ncbi:hypothetical protein HPB49_006872 [Dermacentor silvarum]|uniref:Uncharacterized protein n=1 Tax=Dermacentor silvarum TaxID=543639 RepID=A0ACB8DIN8_DERSI|nr:hypothetical protein HPB49_006872 [Dermacentor silvarum]
MCGSSTHRGLLFLTLRESSLKEGHSVVTRTQPESEAPTTTSVHRSQAILSSKIFIEDHQKLAVLLDQLHVSFSRLSCQPRCSQKTTRWYWLVPASLLKAFT